MSSKRLIPNIIIFFLAPLIIIIVISVCEITDELSIQIISIIISLIPSMFKVLYENWFNFFFFTNRIVLYLLNNSIIWSISAEIPIPENDIIDLRNIQEKNIESYFPNTSCEKSEDYNRIIHVNQGFHINLFTYHKDLEIPFDYEGNNCLIFSIKDINVPFRTAKKTLNQVLKLISDLDASIEGPSIKRKYNFSLRFENKNPYINLFIDPKKVQDNIRHLYIDLDLPEQSSQENVVISKNKLSISSTNFICFEKLSKNYLSLNIYNSQ